MQYNEYCFYIRSNTAQFIQCKIEYQENLNGNDFENQEHGLRFLTTFYKHYLKVIEFNKDLRIISTITKN
jgi:hypothetical protein